MPQQRLQPAATGHHVGVQEGDVVTGGRPQTGVAGGGGTAVAAVAKHLNGAFGAAEILGSERFGRAVVDNDDPQSA